MDRCISGYRTESPALVTRYDTGVAILIYVLINYYKAKPAESTVPRSICNMATLLPDRIDRYIFELWPATDCD